MLSVDEATRLIHSHALPPATEELAWHQCCGRVLAQPVTADRDFPPFDRVAMDGIALSLDSWNRGCRRFPIEGRMAAGQARGRLQDPAACLEVMTGAPLPEGCDTVIPVEQRSLEGTFALVADGVAPQPMAHIHARGSDRRAGDLLLQPGNRLRSPEIAVLATVGQARVRVVALPRIRVIATGDELVPVEHLPLPHQIRLSNGHALVAALHGAGYPVPPCTWVPDEQGALDAILEEALEHAQVIVVSGGVSMGALDLVPAVLERLGVECVFHRVAQRPGKPLWFGRGPAGQAVFALPGNPVSTAVCLHRYVLPWLEAGQTGVIPPGIPVRLAGDLAAGGPLTRFLPVALEDAPDGGRLARPVPVSGSADFAPLCASHGFVELQPGTERITAGTVLPCRLWK